jgi:hypothetical protein
VGDHIEWYYVGTDANGDSVSFQVALADGPFSVQQFVAAGASKGKTAFGDDCTPVFPPPDANDSPLVVDHTFSDTTPPVMISGSFSEPRSASGTFRFTSLVDSCDTGTVSWTASCLNATPPCPTSPTFTRTGSEAKVSTRGTATIPLRIGCPPPGVDCRISVAATARRKSAKLGRSRYLVKVGTSDNARFRLTAKGRRLLRRLNRVKANVEIIVTRGSVVTKKTVTIRLKAPKRPLARAATTRSLPRVTRASS